VFIVDSAIISLDPMGLFAFMSFAPHDWAQLFDVLARQAAPSWISRSF